MLKRGVGLAALLVVIPASVARSQNLDMGSTYELLDSQAVRVTTEFVDAQAITQRTPGPTGSSPAIIGPLSLDGNLARPARDPSQAGTGRARGARHVRQLRQMERSVTTEFGDLVVRAERSETPTKPPGLEEGTLYSATYTTRLVNERTGKTLGFARFFEAAKVFVWDMAPISSGYVSDETVTGGWTFDHNMAWSNIQMFAFWHFGSQRTASLDSILAANTHASSSAGGLTPITAKNEVGCDFLHRLDGTIYRACCDQHDACYGYDPQSNEQTRDDPCTFWSWLFVEGWRCTQCNIEVLICFLTTSKPNGGGGGDDGNPCTVTGAQWCPAECFDCDRSPY